MAMTHLQSTRPPAGYIFSFISDVVLRNEKAKVRQYDRFCTRRENYGGEVLRNFELLVTLWCVRCMKIIVPHPRARRHVPGPA